MRIREARRRDALALVALQRSVLAEGRWFIRTEDEAPSLDEVERDLGRYASSPNSVWLVAEVEGRLAGHLMLTGGLWKRTRQVGSFVVMVDAAHRRHGLGRGLVEAAIAWATRCDMLERVCLNVMDDNPAALSLYRSLGFAEEGRRAGHLHDVDGVVRGEVWMGRAVGQEQPV